MTVLRTTNRFSQLRILALLVTALMMLPALPSQAVSDDQEITFNGSGWGHGVGMSQYGAYGMALNGDSASKIISHYYRGTSVVKMSSLSLPSFINSSEPLWIGLLQDQIVTTFEMSGGGADLCQAGDGEGPCPKAVRPEDGETWRFLVRDDGQCMFKRIQPSLPTLEGSPGDCRASLTPDSGATVTVLDEGVDYSNGKLRFRPVPSNPETFHVSLQLGIDAYLRGIAEMPTWWHMDALKAQVIAARSYLVSNTVSKGAGGDSFSTSVKESCWCHLFDDTRSQVYKGDILLGNPRWQNAVSSTAKQVAAYNGTLVRAFYSSSTGGATENVQDVWGGNGVPWLVSVDDRWAHIPEVDNPMSSWTRIRNAGWLASKVGLDELESIEVDHRASGGVATITFRGVTNGSKKTVTRTGPWARINLNLPSHYFDVKGISEGETSAYQTSSNSSTPIGWVDGVTDTGNGSFRVRGWALDFDTELPIIVHIYVDGKFAKGVWADNKRADVGRTHNNGDRHGFDATVGAGDGSHTVCVYAINAPTKSGNPRIGCKTVRVTTSGGGSSSSSPSQPFGWIDNISTSEGQLTARGWAIDKDAPDKAVPIHIYVDGRFFRGGSADEYRADVGRAHGLGARHGFELSKSLSGGSHRVCIYAINLPEKSNNPLLGCETVTVSTSGGGGSSSSSSSAGQPFGWIDAVSVSGGNLNTKGWAIDKDASDKPVPIHIYVDGRFFQGGPADTYRPDVDTVHGLGTHHGFQLSKPISGGSHRVCIYAINLPEKSNNPLLGCKTVSG